MRARGFTLVEICIVLVIIGLIVGGIIGGRSLANSSRRDLIVSESQKYLQAIRTFKAQYNAWPGDFMTATSRWSGTANGNGNGSIATATEGVRVWQHLNLSGVLPEGSYPGTGAVNPTGATPTVPPSRAVDGAGYQLAGQVDLFTLDRGNALLFGVMHDNSGVVSLTGGALIAKDAQAVDRKMDDGLADSGSVLAAAGQENATPACTDQLSTHAPPVAYVVSDTEGLCYLLFRLVTDRY